MDNGKDDIIEGTAVVVHEAPPNRQFQAVIRPSKEPEKGLSNILIESPVANKETAWFALVDYLIARSNVPNVKAIFRSFLLGRKPESKKINATKFHFIFSDDDGPIIAFDVTLVEV